jgi:Rrf2 family protein
MKLNHASGYALAALVHMAGPPGGRPVPSHQIAQARGVPERFLLKLLKPLVDIGVLRSVRGPNGGYRLARAPKDVTLLEVVEAVDGPVRGDAPAVGGGEGAALDKRLQAVCDGAAALVRERLGKVTLAELAKGK